MGPRGLLVDMSPELGRLLKMALAADGHDELADLVDGLDAHKP